MNAIKFLLYVGDGGMSFPGNLTKPITCIYLWQKMIKYQREIVAGRAWIVNKVQQEKITERKREI